ncbi:glutathione peroxidase [Rhodopila sp.]|jgi:glutathione peroxidase|uniref:glutathione peroxidase n=1 Tax=Rhodopila sp. TaxID=2480087 RepID=UPI002BC0E6E1|nr:glutathione peroxidase [Rhodopila sp.]HVZ08405.1 glutathione peroxidase [Rhodopila sp.]
MSVYDFTARRNDGTQQSLADYRGQVLLIVNTASRCGFTPQYKGLQALQDRFGGRGFSVLGFPCDQFGHQEPGSDADIRAFCDNSFGIDFPLFARIEVNGPGAHPLYRFLKARKRGLLTRAIKWNFTKFLIGRDGSVLARFPPTRTPEAIAPAIDKALS